MQCIFISFLFNTAPITFVLRGKRDFSRIRTIFISRGRGAAAISSGSLAAKPKIL